MMTPMKAIIILLAGKAPHAFSPPPYSFRFNFEAYATLFDQVYPLV